jgi:hypothetical protein
MGKKLLKTRNKRGEVLGDSVMNLVMPSPDKSKEDNRYIYIWIWRQI